MAELGNTAIDVNDNLDKTISKITLTGTEYLKIEKRINTKLKDVKKMDNEIKKVLENTLNQWIDEESLEVLYYDLKELNDKIDPDYANVISSLYGTISAFYIFVHMGDKERPVTVEESTEFLEWFKNEAVKKIEKALSKHNIGSDESDK